MLDILFSERSRYPKFKLSENAWMTKTDLVVFNINMSKFTKAFKRVDWNQFIEAYIQILKSSEISRGIAANTRKSNF